MENIPADLEPVRTDMMDDSENVEASSNKGSICIPALGTDINIKIEPDDTEIDSITIGDIVGATSTLNKEVTFGHEDGDAGLPIDVGIKLEAVSDDITDGNRDLERTSAQDSFKEVSEEVIDLLLTDIEADVGTITGSTSVVEDSPAPACIPDEPAVCTSTREEDGVWPDCWTRKMAESRLENYPWLIYHRGNLGCRFCRDHPVTGISGTAGSQLSSPWLESKVNYGDSNTQTKKCSSLRHKIKKHSDSHAHRKAAAAFTKLTIEDHKKYQDVTERIVRVVYNLVKLDCPFTDLPHWVDCFKLNDCDMGRLPHSEKSCQDIASSISSDMRRKLCENVIATGSYLSILVDVCTSIGGLQILMLHLRAIVSGKPTTFFLDAVHLETTCAQSVVESILSILRRNGFTENYLSEHLICFASDGASFMAGTGSGVAKRLVAMFPGIILWHCVNHRLELAVGDAVVSCTGINYFRTFLDDLYSLYSQSPKNQQKLKKVSADLEAQLLELGSGGQHQDLDRTWWAATSLTAAQAVWESFPALTHYVSGESTIINSGKSCHLLNSLTSKRFLLYLGVMLDALEKVHHLSTALQERDVSLSQAHGLIQQTIRDLDSMVDCPGTYSQLARTAVELGKFCEIKLNESTNVKTVDGAQFFRCLANSLRSKMLTHNSRKPQLLSCSESLVDQVIQLDSATWPVNYSNDYPQFADYEMRVLCQRFNLKPTESPVQSKGDFQDLNNCIGCIPVSTAECKRSLGILNTILRGKGLQPEEDCLSALMFIRTVGPPIAQFNPKPYARNWLVRGRHSVYQKNSLKRKVPPDSPDYCSHLTNLFC